jgi:hypothetical protein
MNTRDVDIAADELEILSHFPSADELRERLLELGDEEMNVEVVVEDIMQLTLPVKERFLHWWQTGELRDDLEVRGYRISTFADRLGYHLVIAFIDFDSAFKNSESEEFSKMLDDLFSEDRTGRGG